MDQTPLQQTVMDNTDEWTASVPQEANPEWDTSIPQEVVAEINSTTEDVVDEPTNEQPQSYDELFPALPSGGVVVPPTVEENTQTQNNWRMRIASTVITQVFRVPYEERARIDGNNTFGETSREISGICANITTKSGAHIEISSAKDQSLTFLVTGKNDEVILAKKLVLEKFQAQFRQSINIPKEYHKFILGKKGKKLQEIETNTSTKIQVPSVIDNNNDIVVIGCRENVENAIHNMQQISDEQSKQAYEKMEIPMAYHPFIGIVLEDKSKFPGVRVDIPPPSLNKDELSVIGEKEMVLMCKEVALQIYKEMERKCTTVSVEVKKAQHKYVTGTRGAGITEILAETGVSVEIPQANVTSETITLRGPPDKLGAALTLVYAKANSVVAVIIKAPAWLHKYIIGRSGANIKLITAELPKVHVEFTDNDGEIHLEGPVEEVEAARNKLQESIDEMSSRLTSAELIVDSQYYKHIIGKAGSNVNRIRKETNVQISIDDKEGGKNCIRLEGNQEGVAAARQELVEMIAKMENEIEQELAVEQRFHRIIIGTKGDKIREIRDKFNQVLILIPESSGNSEIVKIRGAKDDVDQCHKYLKNMVEDLQEDNYQIKVSIFRQFHKFIIGKAGATINKIREETKTRLDLPSESSNSDEITITGKKENCLKAKERIQAIQDDMANIVEVEIIIPQKFHNAIIGAKGKLIRSISEECGNIAIKFPPTDSKSDKVSIRGPKEDVALAKSKLVELTNEKHISSFTADVKAKPQIHRYLIGKNGANIRKIRERTDTRIIFPNATDTLKDVITIIGKKENVEQARKELEAHISELALIKEDQVQIDPKFHKHFLARRGELIRNLSEQFGDALISFPRMGNNSDMVTLKGPKECVEAVKSRILEIVSDLEQVVSIVVVIPQKYHRTVMGPRGSKVQGVQSEFDVSIKFPDKDMQQENLPNGDVDEVRPNDMVMVSGKQENCAKAREGLLALVPVTQDIEIPFKYHRYIIGQKGETVRALMSEFEVNVQVPPAHEALDRITVSGPPAHVGPAVEAIHKKLEHIYADEKDRQLRNFQVKFHVNPEYHPKIIGKKGVNISKIREKHSVNIQFKQRGDENDDVITITGYENNCNSAKEAILDITGDLENMIKESIEIDARIFPRLIGQRGRAIKKIMDQFKVEVRFPRESDNPNEVVIGGNPDKVEECKDHLLNLAEEFLQDITDQEEGQSHVYNRNENTLENSWRQPSKPSPRGGGGMGRGQRVDREREDSDAPRDAGHANTNGLDENEEKGKGFHVTGAPWTQAAPNVDSSEDFPSMGAVSDSTSMGATIWGPRRS